MKIKNIIAASTIFICAIIYCYSAIDTKTQSVFGVNIDMSMPLSIVWPFEISVIGDNGEKGLRIAPKIGRGWKGEAGGEASYKFYIPQDGRYRLWAYCLWFDDCANAVFARIDTMEKAIVGNDPIYKKWHWARGFDVDLKKGTHTIVLSNHSDHISVLKILLTSSTSAAPREPGLVFSDIFYDGFDGCDYGNFTTWQIINGKWVVQNPTEQMCFTENVLIGESADNSLILYKSDVWSDYSLNLMVKSIPSQDTRAVIGICFGVKDPNNYHVLKIKPVENAGNADLQLVRNTNKQTEVLVNFNVPWQAGKWHQVEISLSNGKIITRVDDGQAVQTPVNFIITGGIGLLLEGKISAYFDDIHVRQITGSTK